MGQVWKTLSGLREYVAERSRRSLVRRFAASDRTPWADGYDEFKFDFIERSLGDPKVMAYFSQNKSLPDRFGVALDERVVEYPWVLSRLSPNHAAVLDAGSALNFRSLLHLPVLRNRSIVICTLAPEREVVRREALSYLFCDLRELILRDASFDAVICISTLEHVGLDATQFYTKDSKFSEHDLAAYQSAMRELYRCVKRGGDVFVTVPYGLAEDHGWLQQFDREGLDRLVKSFPGTLVEEAYYRYRPDGWQIATAEECSDSRYFDLHSRKDYLANPEPDRAAAARSVACLHLRKP